MNNFEKIIVWFKVGAVAVTTALAIVLPVFVIQSIHAQADASREDRIRVNVATIACLFKQGDAEFSRFDLEVCIREVLAEVTQPTVP